MKKALKQRPRATKRIERGDFRLWTTTYLSTVPYDPATAAGAPPFCCIPALILPKHFRYAS